jgi:hypothetical protein
MGESLDDLMKKVRGRVEALEARRLSRLDAVDISTKALLPFKALIYRETLIWRMAELSRSAFTSFAEDKLVSAILLTRAAVETSAILWNLCDNIEAAIAENVVDDIDDYLSRLIFANRAYDKAWEAFNVLNLVERIDKEAKGFRGIYNILSEFAHPNLAGAAGRYMRLTENLGAEFGVNIGSHGDSKQFGVSGLNLALTLFENRYHRVTEILPAFITLCEDHLKAATPRSSRASRSAE